MASALVSGASAGDARASIVRASVRVGAVETAYLRAGAGPVVLVLDPGLAAVVHADGVPEDWHAHRLIVPMHATIAALAAPARSDEDASAFACWLRGFIDGVGLTEVTVVVPAAQEAEVRRFANANPGEIARIVTPPLSVEARAPRG